jgi:hypothetical protein
MQIIKNTNQQQLIKKIPGNYYTENYFTATATSAGTITTSAISYYCFVLSESLNIAEIGFNITAAAAPTTLGRFNLYDSDPNTLLPKNKLFADQTILLDSTGFKAFTINSFLKSGLYYFAGLRPGGTVTVTTKANFFEISSFIGLGATAAFISPYVGTRLSTYSFGSTFPNIAIQDSPNITYLTASPPVLWYKVQ